MILRFGRWGMDVEIDSPVAWRDSSTDRVGQQVNVSGDLVFATLADMEAARTELLEQVGMLIAVTWSANATRDGFYKLLDGNIELISINATGSLSRFTASLLRHGGVGQQKLESLLTTVALTNDFTITDAKSEPFHAVPVGSLTYDTDGTPTAIERTSEDGDLPVFTDIDLEANPTWSVEPSTYYSGAAEIWVSDYLRAGLDAPNDPGNFKMTNGMVEFTPGEVVGVSNGILKVATYDGAWDTALEYGVYYNATTLIPKWHYCTIICNTPEICTLRLVRDAAEAPPTASLHVLDVSLRRGSRFLECLYTWTGGTIDVEIRRETIELAVAVTPTGASGPFGIRASANDAGGNRYVMGCPSTQTQDLTNGRIKKSTTNVMAFMLGAEVGGSGAAAGDQAADLLLQYIGSSNEMVRAVRR